MTHFLTTHANNRIIVIHIDTHLSIEEWQQLSQDIYDQLSYNDAKTHVIMNMLNNKTHPYNLTEIVRTSVWVSHSNLFWTINVTESNLTKMLGSMTIGMYKGRYKTLPTLEEGFAFLYEVDATLEADADFQSEDRRGQ